MVVEVFGNNMQKANCYLVNSIQSRPGRLVFAKTGENKNDETAKINGLPMRCRAINQFSMLFGASENCFRDQNSSVLCMFFRSLQFTVLVCKTKQKVRKSYTHIHKDKNCYVSIIRIGIEANPL